MDPTPVLRHHRFYGDANNARARTLSQDPPRGKLPCTQSVDRLFLAHAFAYLLEGSKLTRLRPRPLRSHGEEHLKLSRPLRRLRQRLSRQEKEQQQQ